MPFFPTSKEESTTRYIDNLTRNTRINQMVPGAKARTVGESFAQEVELLSQVEEGNFEKGFLSTTYGQFLDRFASTYGLSSRLARNAQILASDRVVKFYVHGGGTFGSINSGVAFTVPAGTVLTAPADVPLEQTDMFQDIAEADNPRDRSIHYVITEQVICGVDDTEAWVSARALVKGTAGNLASPGMLTQHPFADYTDRFKRVLRVTNVNPILSGVDAEDPSSLKYRVSKAVTAAESSNETAIADAVLGVPGVADYVLAPFEDGPGRFNIYIKSVATTVSDRIIADVQSRLNDLRAVGIIGYARKPFEIGVELSSNLSYTQKLKEEEKQLIRSNLTFGAMAYINSLDIGQPLILTELASDLRTIDPRVATVGSSQVSIFDSVYVWYPARLASGGRRREKLIQKSVLAASNARIIIEPSITTPVQFI